MKEKRRAFDMIAMQNTSSTVKPINTVGLEGPVIKDVASNQALHAYSERVLKSLYFERYI